MSLTDPEVRSAKPSDKTRRLCDEKGLYVEVSHRAANAGGSSTDLAGRKSASR